MAVRWSAVMRCEGSGERPIPVAHHGRSLGALGLVRRWLPGVVLPLRVGIGRTPLAHAQDVRRGVEGDACQPATERVTSEAREVAIRVEERLLRGVGCRFAVAGHAHGQREQVVLVELHDPVEGIEVARQALLDERAVASVQLLGGPAGGVIHG